MIIPSSEFAKNIYQFLDDLSSGKKSSLRFSTTIGLKQSLFPLKNMSECIVQKLPMRISETRGAQK